MVGRDDELRRLHGSLDQARTGKRQVIFISGEPGIGKTTLTEAFAASLSDRDDIIVVRGQCMEQYGSTDVYLPFLDVVEQLCSLNGKNEALSLLQRHAPSWLANLPSLVGSSERTDLARRSVGIGAERRLREIARFLEAMSADKTLLLVLEDIHWLDNASLNLLSYLARRNERAKLLILATYREGEIELSGHPLKQIKADLDLHGYCFHHPLALLNRNSVEAYLAARFESDQVSESLATEIYSRSEGNPLFMVNFTDNLLSRGAVVYRNGWVDLSPSIKVHLAPTSLAQLILQQFAALPAEDRQLLEVACVRGVAFSSALLMSALNTPVEAIERRCEALAGRELFIRRQGSVRWPDGSIGSRYDFIHALYQNVIYARLNEGSKIRLHKFIAERLEAAYQNQTEEIAAELALHFERAGDYDRAIGYLFQSALRALRQAANQEAIEYASKGLCLAEPLADNPARKEIKLNLQLALAVATCASKGYAAEETKHAFVRSREFSKTARNDAATFQSLAGLFSFHLLRGEPRAAFDIARGMLTIAQRIEKSMFLVNAQMALGAASFYQGKFNLAHRHFQLAAPHYDFDLHRSSVPLFAWDPGVIVHCYDAQAVWFLGFPHSAEKTGEAGLGLVKMLGSPFNEAVFYGIHSVYYAYRNDAPNALAFAEKVIELSTSNGFPHWLAAGTISKGWALSTLEKSREGLSLLLDGIEKWRSTGAEMIIPAYLEFLAAAYQRVGNITQALGAVEEGLTVSARNNDRHYDAELYRRKGELLLENNGKSNHGANDPVDCFLRAISVARRQNTRSLELRATISLARYLSTKGKTDRARTMLVRIYDHFDERQGSRELAEAATHRQVGLDPFVRRSGHYPSLPLMPFSELSCHRRFLVLAVPKIEPSTPRIISRPTWLPMARTALLPNASRSAPTSLFPPPCAGTRC
jgi:energy-coupling factor transporter ATP-binding protein EcfA2